MIREVLQLLKKDNLHSQALAHCEEMLVLCQKMLSTAVSTLRGRGEVPEPLDIHAVDKTVNAFERDVRRKVMIQLSVGGDSSQVSGGLVLVSIVIDLERIGDYSKNIFDLARNHGRRLEVGPVEEDLQAIENATLECFEQTSQAFRTGDIELARKVMGEYKGDVSKPARKLEQRLIGGIEGIDTPTAVVLALYLRSLKRIAAHSRNLATSIVNPFDRIGYRE